MKMDYSCARAILIALEDTLSLSENADGSVSVNKANLESLCKSDILSEYSKAEIAYCSDKLIEAGYIDARAVKDDSGTILRIVYFSITFNGHEYLDDVRNPKIWSLIQEEFLKKSIDMTFPLIKVVAQAIRLSILNS